MPRPFAELHDAPFLALAPAAQIAYVHAARAADAHEAATRALQLIAYSYERLIVTLVRAKMPADLVEETADAALARVVGAITRNPPEAASAVQFRAWLAQIVRHEIAEYHRSPGAKAAHDTVSLNAAAADADDGGWDIPVTDGGYAAVEYGELVDRALGELSDEHRLIVELRVFEGRRSKTVAAILADERGLEYTPANIDKIASRFCAAARGRLNEE